MRNDRQPNGHARAHGCQRLQQRRGWEPCLPLAHVHQDGFQLEVRAQDAADVEHLVAVPNVVEVPRREPLGEVGGEDEAVLAG